MLLSKESDRFTMSLKFSNADVAQSKPLPPCDEGEFESHAWGIENFGEDFKMLTIPKPKVGEHDVKIEMKFCGICHTDVHMCLNEMSAAYGKYIHELFHNARFIQLFDHFIIFVLKNIIHIGGCNCIKLLKCWTLMYYGRWPLGYTLNT